MLALDIPDHPAQINSHFPGASFSPFHLTGIGIAALLGQELFGLTVVVLTKGNIPCFGSLDQILPGAVIQPGIGGKADLFFLYRGIDIDPGKLNWLDSLKLQSRLDGLYESSSAPASPILFLQFLQRVMLEG
jgi:hypothetical protein